MPRFASGAREEGVTLVELVTAVGILSVLLGLSASFILRSVDASRMRTLNNDFLTHLRLIRSEAISRGQRAVMCVSTTGLRCAPHGGWHSGWLLFEDTNNNGLRDNEEEIIGYRPAAPYGWVIAGNGSVARYVSYDGLGSSRLANGGFQAGTITICKQGARSLPVRQIVINSMGRPRSQEAAADECP